MLTPGRRVGFCHETLCAYNLYVGIYNIITQERVSVVDDITGEDAICLGKINVR